MSLRMSFAPYGSEPGMSMWTVLPLVPKKPRQERVIAPQLTLFWRPLLILSSTTQQTRAPAQLVLRLRPLYIHQENIMPLTDALQVSPQYAEYALLHDARAVHDTVLVRFKDFETNGVHSWAVLSLTPSTQSGAATIPGAS